MKIVFAAAVAVLALVAFSESANAQSNDAILKRLNALESENLALRQRVQRLETKKVRVASVQPESSIPTLPPAPLYRSPAMSAQASAYNTQASAMMPSNKWNGFYVGAHGGYAFSDWLVPSQDTGLVSNMGLHGGFGGIQMGYNIQLSPHWLIGVEQDASLGRVSARQEQTTPSPTITGTTNAFGTLRGRFGYIWNDVLLYETAGIAWAYNTAKLEFPGMTFQESHLQWGVVVGAGIEWFITPSISAKGEFQYLYLTKEQYFGGTTEAATAGWPLATGRLGLNWHFN